MVAAVKIDIRRSLHNATFLTDPSPGPKPRNTLTLMFGGSTLDTADYLLEIHDIDPELGQLLELLIKKYEKP